MWSEPPPPRGGGGVYMGLHKNVSTSSRNRPRGPGEMKSEERSLALARAPSAFISAHHQIDAKMAEETKGEIALPDGRLIESLKVVELKHELKKHGLSLAGSKSQLAERLKAVSPL